MSGSLWESSSVSCWIIELAYSTWRICSSCLLGYCFLFFSLYFIPSFENLNSLQISLLRKDDFLTFREFFFELSCFFMKLSQFFQPPLEMVRRLLFAAKDPYLLIFDDERLVLEAGLFCINFYFWIYLGESFLVLESEELLIFDLWWVFFVKDYLYFLSLSKLVSLILDIIKSV